MATGSAALANIAGARGSGRNSNKDRADQVHEQAVQIYNSTGSKEKAREHIARNSDYVVSETRSFAPKRESDDDVSTQNWSEDAISTTLDVTHYTSDCASKPIASVYYWVTINSGFSDNGENGPDTITISWSDNHYLYVEGSQQYDRDYKHLSNKKESLTGFAWEYDDYSACSYGCSERNFYVYTQAYIQDTTATRAIEASYWDQWKSAEVESVSFSSSGDVTFTFSKTGRTDQYGYEVTYEWEAQNGC